jgi:hypothetical protein
MKQSGNLKRFIPPLFDLNVLFDSVRDFVFKAILLTVALSGSSASSEVITGNSAADTMIEFMIERNLFDSIDNYDHSLAISICIAYNSDRPSICRAGSGNLDRCYKWMDCPDAA